MNVLGLNHYLICAPAELMEQCREFYCGVLGLRVGGRPNSPRAGYWLYREDQSIVHLAVPRPGESPSPSKNHLDHVAFSCADLRGTLNDLKSLRVPYDLSVLQGEYAQVQVIIKDPAGTVIELNFKEPLPEGETAHRDRLRERMA